jgi:hypothetical protein
MEVHRNGQGGGWPWWLPLLLLAAGMALIFVFGQ